MLKQLFKYVVRLHAKYYQIVTDSVPNPLIGTSVNNICDIYLQFAN